MAVAVPKKPKKKAPKSLPKLEKELDAIFSLYIRMKNASESGYCVCYTCNSPGLIKDMQCGHLLSRAKKATRFDEENVRVQCVSCNIFRRGNYDVFHPKIIMEIGHQAYFVLISRSKEPVKRTREWYNTMIEKYREKIKLLEAKNG